MQNIRSILLNNKESVNICSKEAIELFKIYLDSIERIADKRQNANNFFLTLNTGIIIIIGFLFNKDVNTNIKAVYLFTPVVGIIANYFWLKLVDSYRQLNRGKFVILNLIEEYLPLAPYKAEWIELAEGKDKKIYHPLTNLEKWIQKVFIILYLILEAYFIYIY